MKTITLGLIGVGRIGLMHANNISILNDQLAEKDVRVALKITDVASDYGRNVAAGVGAEFVETVDELLAAGIDGVLVATGTETHVDLIKAGVAVGIPVFCEKPVGVDVAQSLEALDFIREHQGVVQIGHQRRFDVGYLEAKRALDAGELGWLHTVRAITGDMVPPAVEFLATSGGLFRDCSVHDFDILSWLTGQKIVEVYAKGSNNGDPAIGEVGDVDTALAVVTFDNGLVGTVVATRYNGAGHDVRLEIQGSEGSLAVGLDDHTAIKSAEPGISYPSGTPHTNFIERFHDAYVAELAAFVDLVQGKGHNPCTPEEAIAASRVADAAQESLLTGVAVRVPA